MSAQGNLYPPVENTRMSVISDELKDIADRSRSGASEREIETDLVQVFRSIGWPRAQIKQDVPVSDRAIDKVDIILSLDEHPALLVEVKRHGLTRDAEGQLRRYCALRRPALALLTDGVRWVIYYVGQRDITIIIEESGEAGLSVVADFLSALVPMGMDGLMREGVFNYLNLVDEALLRHSTEERHRLLPHFVATANALLLPVEHSRVTQAEVKLSPIVPPDATPQTQSRKCDQAPSNHPAASSQSGDYHTYDPDHPPSLLHTGVEAAKFGQTPASNWNSLIRVAVGTAYKAGILTSTLRHRLKLQLAEGTGMDGGYVSVPDTPLAVQRMESSRAWQNVLLLARELQVEVEVKFYWQNKPEAARPGETAILRWPPNRNS